MQPSSTHWRHLWLHCLALCASTGFWAGSAAAQADDGGWFDGAAPRAAEREPQQAEPAPPPEPDYSPPPPNFQARPEAPPQAADEEIVEDDPEAQRRAVEEFSPRLAPYGSWVEDSRYGRVWVPSRTIVGAEFVPYSTGGHWALTPDDNWIWVSDYPFGAVTFHYGRWVHTSSYWAWVPGYVYAPAWVDFHVGAAGYVGWSPLAPRHVWRSGLFVSVGLWGPPPVVFCPTRYVFVRSMPRYVVRDRVRVRSMAAQTRVYRSPRYLSGNYVARGPSPAELRIPRSALPERRVEYRRVIAEPRVTARSRTSSRLQLADGARPGGRAEGQYRSRAARPPAQVPSRERSYQAAPRGYDGWRGHSDGARGPSGRGLSERGRAYPDGGRGYSGRSSARTHDRPEMLRQRPGERRMDSRAAQRGSMWGGERREPGRSAAPRAQPRPEAPAVAPRERPRSAYGQERGRGAARGGAPPAVQHRAPRPAPDTRGNGRRQRRDDSSAGDSRNRGRERYGSGR